MVIWHWMASDKTRIVLNLKDGDHLFWHRDEKREGGQVHHPLLAEGHSSRRTETEWFFCIPHREKASATRIPSEMPSEKYLKYNTRIYCFTKKKKKTTIVKYNTRLYCFTLVTCRKHTTMKSKIFIVLPDLWWISRVYVYLISHQIKLNKIIYKSEWNQLN